MAIVLLLLDAALVDVIVIVAVWMLAIAAGRYAVGVDKAMLLDAALRPASPFPVPNGRCC